MNTSKSRKKFLCNHFHISRCVLPISPCMKPEWSCLSNLPESTQQQWEHLNSQHCKFQRKGLDHICKDNRTHSDTLSLCTVSGCKRHKFTTVFRCSSKLDENPTETCRADGKGSISALESFLRQCKMPSFHWFQKSNVTLIGQRLVPSRMLQVP